MNPICLIINIMLNSRKGLFDNGHWTKDKRCESTLRV